jgi:hypothetical protein
MKHLVTVPLYLSMPGMKGGIHFTDRYLRIRLRSSGKARIGLREYRGGGGGSSVKGTYGTSLRGTKTTRSLLSLVAVSLCLYFYVIQP